MQSFPALVSQTDKPQKLWIQMIQCLEPKNETNMWWKTAFSKNNNKRTIPTCAPDPFSDLLCQASWNVSDDVSTPRLVGTTLNHTRISFRGIPMPAVEVAPCTWTPNCQTVSCGKRWKNRKKLPRHVLTHGFTEATHRFMYFLRQKSHHKEQTALEILGFWLEILPNSLATCHLHSWKRSSKVWW